MTNLLSPCPCIELLSKAAVAATLNHTSINIYALPEQMKVGIRRLLTITVDKPVNLADLYPINWDYIQKYCGGSYNGK